MCVCVANHCLVKSCSVLDLLKLEKTIFVYTNMNYWNPNYCSVKGRCEFCKPTIVNRLLSSLKSWWCHAPTQWLWCGLNYIHYYFTLGYSLCKVTCTTATTSLESELHSACTDCKQTPEIVLCHYPSWKVVAAVEGVEAEAGICEIVAAVLCVCIYCVCTVCFSDSLRIRQDLSPGCHMLSTRCFVCVWVCVTVASWDRQLVKRIQYAVS